MGSEKLISHTIQIAGESYPVKLTKEEMSYATEIEQELNDKISEYKVKFLVKTTKDILAMLLLTYAFELRKSNPKLISDYNLKLERLIHRITEQVDK